MQTHTLKHESYSSWPVCGKRGWRYGGTSLSSHHILTLILINSNWPVCRREGWQYGGTSQSSQDLTEILPTGSPPPSSRWSQLHHLLTWWWRWWSRWAWWWWSPPDHGHGPWYWCVPDPAKSPLLLQDCKLRWSDQTSVHQGLVVRELKIVMNSEHIHRITSFWI